MRVVLKVQEKIIQEARHEGIQITVLESTQGDQNGTLLSSLLLLKGENLPAFIQAWQGTIQWIAQSPYRRFHKRKNWFVGVQSFEMTTQMDWNEKEVRFETFRASGAGGQHVNKVESAVRGVHIPSGIQVVAMDSRSQIQNKKTCIERLKAKIIAWQTEQIIAQQSLQWNEHNALERGNPRRVFQEKL
jgi:peptide chain release factor